MPHVLVAGGTGMLREVCLYFASHGCTVSVIARDQSKFNEMIESKSEYGFINPIKVDYSDYFYLEEKLRSAIDNYGKIETAVCWIHSSAPEAPYVIADVLNNQGVKCKYFQVLGSSEANPFTANVNIHFTFERFVNLIYKKIILGFVIDDEKSRWLTEIEISNGVIDAIVREQDSYIIGKVEPWEMKP